jgi:hypothetical protein
MGDGSTLHRLGDHALADVQGDDRREHRRRQEVAKAIPRDLRHEPQFLLGFEIRVGDREGSRLRWRERASRYK